MDDDDHMCWFIWYLTLLSHTIKDIVRCNDNSLSTRSRGFVFGYRHRGIPSLLFFHHQEGNIFASDKNCRILDDSPLLTCNRCSEVYVHVGDATYCGNDHPPVMKENMSVRYTLHGNNTQHLVKLLHVHKSNNISYVICMKYIYTSTKVYWIIPLLYTYVIIMLPARPNHTQPRLLHGLTIFVVVGNFYGHSDAASGGTWTPWNDLRLAFQVILCCKENGNRI